MIRGQAGATNYSKAESFYRDLARQHPGVVVDKSVCIGLVMKYLDGDENSLDKLKRLFEKSAGIQESELPQVPQSYKEGGAPTVSWLPSGAEFSRGTQRKTELPQGYSGRPAPENKYSDEYAAYLEDEKGGCLDKIKWIDQTVIGVDGFLQYAQKEIDDLQHQRDYPDYGNVMAGGIGGAIVGGIFGAVVGSVGLENFPLCGSAGLGLVVGGVGVASLTYASSVTPKLSKLDNEIFAKRNKLHEQSMYRASLLADRQRAEHEIREIEKELDSMVPDINVKAVFDKLIEETYAPVDLVVSNDGGRGPAYDVVCVLHGPVDGEATATFKGRVEVGEEKRKTLSLKPSAKGKMRWVFDITYRDCLRREHREEQNQWIDSEHDFAPPPIIQQIGMQIVGSEIHGQVGDTLVAGNVNGGIVSGHKEGDVFVKDSVLSNSIIGKGGQGDKHSN